MIKCEFLSRRMKKERELRHIIMSHESFSLDLPASGKMDESTLNFKGSYAVDEKGDIERLFGTFIEYAGKWTPMTSVIFSKRQPTVATFVLKTDLADLDADVSGIDGFDLVLRPFSKPIRDNALEKGHVRFWLTRESYVNESRDGSDSGDDTSDGADNHKYGCHVHDPIIPHHTPNK